MVNNFVASLPVWGSLWKAIREERSVLLCGPRHYRKTWILRQIGLDCRSEGWADCFLIELVGPNDRTIDYPRLFEGISKKLGMPRRGKVRDSFDFARGLRKLLEREPKRTLLLIRCGESGLEDEKFEFLASLHDLLVEDHISDFRKLAVIATDNYSLWHHQQYGHLISALHMLHQIHMHPLCAEDILLYLKASPADSIDKEYAREISRVVFDLTGGHIGLVGEVLDNLALDEKPFDQDSLRRILHRRLGHSAVIARIQQAIREAPRGLAETALAYKTPEYPLDLQNPQVQLLLQLGILQRTPFSQIILCPGIISELIEEAGRVSRKSTAGVVLGETGATPFNADDVVLGDDDFVVVHISDLHVGSNHRFRYRDREGRIYNPDRGSLSELIAEDLRGLQLIGRLDALIISGDFAEYGKDSEFRNARIVLGDLMDNLDLAMDQLVILPGNHDIDWGDPLLDSQADSSNPGSRVPFDDFAEHFDHTFGDGAVLRSFVSRSGRRLLRIIGLDSNRVEGKHASGIGYIAREALDLANEFLRSPIGEGIESETIWFSFHHHIFPATSVRLQEAQRGKVTVMANAAEILAYATHWSAEVLLHGHEHQPSVTITRRWPSDGMGRNLVPIISVGAGSIGAEQRLLGSFGRNQYFVLYRRDSDLILRSRCLGHEGIAFGADSDLVVPLQGHTRIK